LRAGADVRPGVDPADAGESEQCLRQGRADALHRRPGRGKPATPGRPARRQPAGGPLSTQVRPCPCRPRRPALLYARGCSGSGPGGARPPADRPAGSRSGGTTRQRRGARPVGIGAGAGIAVKALRKRRVGEVANENAGSTIPAWVTDLSSFDRWVDSPEFPSRGRYSFLRGAVWSDTSTEDALTHDCAKLWVGLALGMVTRSRDLGNY